MSAAEASLSGSTTATLLDAKCESQMAEVLSMTLDSRAAEALAADVSVADVALEVDGTVTENIVFESLGNLLCTGFFNSAAETRLKKVCASIDITATAALSDYIDCCWKAQWSSVPEFLRSDIPGRQTEMKNAWFQNEFESILKSFVDAGRAASFSFVPELSVDALEAGSRAKAAGLLLQVKEKHVPGIEAAVRKAFESET